MNRAPIFAAIKQLPDRKHGQAFTRAEVALIDRGIDEAFDVIVVPPPSPTTGRQVSHRAIDLMHSFEQCKLEAYPDPGSADGTPWTIGWGSTGPDVRKGLTWTQAQCDARFAADLAVFSAGVDKAIGDAPTTQSQFDAMVCLAYNIGLKAFRGSTVLRKHRAGDYLGAARAFLMWNKNDGKVMRGLTRRRLAESDLYDDG